MGAPFSRFAAPVSAAEITFERLALAALAVLGVALLQRRALRWTLRPGVALLGATLYAHFFLFTLAAQTTTTAHTLAIVYTSPVLVALGLALLLREVPRRTQLVGILVAVLGIGLLVGFEPAQSGAGAAGDLAAFGSAVALAVYLIAGRSLRAAAPLVTYLGGVYAWGALFALPAAILGFEPAAYDAARVGAIVILGLVPLGVGHTLLNAAIRRVPASIPSVISTQEVTGGVVLGAFMFGDVPGPNALAGGIIALAGVILVVVFAAPAAPRAAGPP